MDLNKQNSAYEFSHKQNRTIEVAGRSVQIWGVAALSIGIISAIIGTAVVAVTPDLTSTRSLVQLSVLLPLALALLVMGKSYLSSGNALLGVVDTHGDDVDLLTVSLSKLSTAIKLEVIVTTVAIMILIWSQFLVGDAL